MKRIILITFAVVVCVFFCSFFSLLFGNNISPKRKAVFKVCDQLSGIFKKKYGLHYIGISEAAPKGKYDCVGLDLRCNRILTKDEGRVLLLQCAEEVLNAFNSRPEFEQHFANFPVNGNNIIVNIITCSPDTGDVYYPDIVVFSFHGDKLEFLTDAPEMKWEYFTEEEETWEEAWKIVDAQSRGELPFNSNKLASNHTRRESRRR